MERPEQLATGGTSASTTTTTSSKQSVGQTARTVEPTTTANTNEPSTGKDAGDMVTREQEVPKQGALEQAHEDTLSKGQVPETSQSMPE
jgi:hypothetical protein